MHRFLFTALTAGLVVSACHVSNAEDLPSRTALDDYIATPDSNYEWKVVSRQKSPEGQAVVVEMVSQNWRTKDEVDRTEWRHWLTMAIPANVKSDVGLLWIGGGRNGGDPPAQPDGRIQSIAKATGTVVAELKMVPNQPLMFHGDGQKRTEDDLVAYTWDQFLKTGDATWPARNPMVKSAVRAMDTITAVTAADENCREVNRFVVAGASKRGWTTWLTGAVDKRVIGIVPIVIDILNVRANTDNHFSAYGFWAPAVGDYVAHRITERMNHPRMNELLKLVDPLSYRHRLTMPKFILNAAGDQFFPPDSSKNYFSQLVGPKHLRYVPNADHSLKNSDAMESLIAWYSVILTGRSLPEFTWTLEGSSLQVKTSDNPIEVRLWQATNPDARDFRLETLGPKYVSRPLTDQGEGTFSATLENPENGWTASFVELAFDVGAPFPLKLTTDVKITPDVLPFKDRNPSLPATITLSCTAPSQKVTATIEKALHSEKIAALTEEMQFHSVDQTGADAAVSVRLNWKPIGGFRASAEVITGWLKEQGCSNFAYQLESGPRDPAE